jgi:demethylmenaquinone methyltransferase/2-methoxy-6-polyprenyl-1,4-benzoquinol methylase
MNRMPEDTHFGYRQVPLGDKQALVDDVFHSVAGRYDLMNDLMSAGLHRAWKDALVTAVNPPPRGRPGRLGETQGRLDRLDHKAGERPFALLDVAGGTGDIAFRVLHRMARSGASPRIIVCDVNPAMLEVGRDRAIDANRLAAIEWVCADAEALPLPDRCVDAYTIAFGIRNATHLDKALAEAYRVLKPGGRFLCLEFSRVAAPGLDDLYDLYSFAVLPRLGELVAGDGAAYRYLAESIRRFPPQVPFVRRIEKAGFSQVKYRNLSAGIAAMHSGWKA